MAPTPAIPVFGLVARLTRGRFALVSIWLLGLAALAGVLVLQQRLDQRRRAQIAVAELRLQINAVPRVALDLTNSFTAAQVRGRLRADEAAIETTAAHLDSLGGNHQDAAMIINRVRPLFGTLDRVNALSSAGHVQAATALLGLILLPGGAASELNAVFDEIDAKYDGQAASARRLTDVGSVAAILLMLVAFSLALHRVAALARENRRLLVQSLADAFTDDLTGLPNRRKLLADVNELLGETESSDSFVLGMFDLNGFKAYNDMFGHPEGDVLLARLGQRLLAVVDGAGRAYRMGGDEFCVIAWGPAGEALLERARETLSEDGNGYCVSCSLGKIRIVPGEMTAAEAFRQADRHLYDDKRASRSDYEAERVPVVSAA